MNSRSALTSVKNVLVLTSTFPRWRGDKDPPFVHELCQRLGPDFRIQVLAPHAPGARLREELDGIDVCRFRYFREAGEVLAYGSEQTGGGILANLKRQPWCYGLVPLFFFAEVLSVARLLRRARFNLIHAHWLIPQGLAAILASRLVGSFVPILCTSHGADLFALRGALWERLKRFVIAACSGLTVVSRTMRERLLQLGHQSTPVRVIPMGVDLEERFIPSPNPRREKSLLFVGRLVEKKGLEYLIRALPRILEKHSEVTLTIVGNGPEQTPAKKLCESLGILPQVSFLGAIPNAEMPARYQASQVVVFPSVVARDGDQEGFGLVMVEALGCECAVVATDLPAIRDIIVDGKTGLIVPEKDPEALADKILMLLENPGLRSALGRDGRSFVWERYDWRNIGAQYRTLFEEMMTVGGREDETRQSHGVIVA
jgi:glycosyltransferase involved in cell wall biosynthesis